MGKKAQRTLGYCRVSTEEQAREGVSLEAQEKQIRRYCDLYGLELVEVLRDEGVSGKSMERPGMVELMSCGQKICRLSSKSWRGPKSKWSGDLLPSNLTHEGFE